MDLESLGRRLAIEEGDRLVAYYDTKRILTVGKGHNCVAKPVPGIHAPGDRITPAQDEELFEQDVNEACAELDSHMVWWRQLDDARQNVMLDLCFNMGINTLATFHDTLRHIQAEQFELAADGMLHSHWNAQVGARATWLENAMRTGVYDA